MTAPFLRAALFAASVALLAPAIVSADPAPAQTAAPSLSPLATALSAALANQCELESQGSYDAWSATMTPDFRRTGPETQDESRDQVVNPLKTGSAKTGMHMASCSITIKSATATPGGAAVSYIEIDRMMMRSLELDDAINATSDFVPGPGGSWLQRDLHRTGFEFVFAGKIIHSEGDMQGYVPPGVTGTPAPVQSSMPADQASAAAAVSIDSCTIADGTAGYSNPGVPGRQPPTYIGPSAADAYVSFTNNAAAAVTRVDFAIVLRGNSYLTPYTVGTFSTGVVINRRFPIARFTGMRVLVKPTCVVLAVQRADGTSWKNPAPPPAAPAR